MSEMALVAAAVMVSGPTVLPVTRREAMPLRAVAAPMFDRVPVPAWENVTEALLDVSTDSETSRTSATRTRLLLDGSGVLDDVITMWYGWIVKVVDPLVTVEL